MKIHARLISTITITGIALAAASSDAQVNLINPDPETKRSATSKTKSRGSVPSKWMEADGNGDGKVTNDEASQLIEQESRSAFAKFDKNRSGEVERKEFPQKAEWLRAFDRLDTDDSESLTFEEGREYFEQRVWKRFQKMDVNDDGLLTADELAPVKPASILESNMERDSNGDGLLSASELASTGDVAYFEDIHIRADVDGSGTVSRTELADEYRRRAMAKDTDEDGGVTLEEFTAGQAQASRSVSKLTYSELDRDGDGRITREDVISQPKKKDVTPKEGNSSLKPESL